MMRIAMNSTKICLLVLAMSQRKIMASLVEIAFHSWTLESLNSTTTLRAGQSFHMSRTSTCSTNVTRWGFSLNGGMMRPARLGTQLLICQPPGLVLGLTSTGVNALGLGWIHVTFHYPRRFRQRVIWV